MLAICRDDGIRSQNSTMVIKIRDWAGHFQTYPAEKGLLNNDKEWPLKANSYAFEVLFAVPIIFVPKKHNFIRVSNKKVRQDLQKWDLS